MGAEPDALAHCGEMLLRAAHACVAYPRRNLHGGPAGISTARAYQSTETSSPIPAAATSRPARAMSRGMLMF
jgi:hypothetical protein